MSTPDELNRSLSAMAGLIAQEQSPTVVHYRLFTENPALVLDLVKHIDAIDETALTEQENYYSACVYGLDVCVAQLQMAMEGDNKAAAKTLQRLMQTLAELIGSGRHSLSFWLPILNAFYEAHIELSDTVKQAYLTLADEEEVPVADEDHLQSMRDLLKDLENLSDFEIAENFFAQSYAMPAAFYAELIIDLYQVDIGHDVAILMLLHPNAEVREVVMATLDLLMPEVLLSSRALSRLQVIQHWYSEDYRPMFAQWIKIQRKKGVLFATEPKLSIVSMTASEIDGGGAQGIFIHLKQQRKYRICGLLFKQQLGIKDAWMTSLMSVKETKQYYEEAFDDSICLREVDIAYVLLITNHFLHVTIQQGGMPDLYVLEIQEALGVQFTPVAIDVNDWMKQLAIQIVPFTQAVMEQAMQHTQTWLDSKAFAESWFHESTHIDKLVNQCCTFVDGARICRFEEAMQLVLTKDMDLDRDTWLFHFFWVTLWMKSKSKRDDKMWQEAFLIAHAIQSGVACAEIPLMREICRQSIIHSIETMQERRTYLH